MSEFGGRPTPQPEREDNGVWTGAWDGDDLSECRVELERLGDVIDERFNPADSDYDQGYILRLAVVNAADYIESQPCTCPSEDDDADEPCDRCCALGRWHDVRVSR